jgi:hypothetical protein
MSKLYDKLKKKAQTMSEAVQVATFIIKLCISPAGWTLSIQDSHGQLDSARIIGSYKMKSTALASYTGLIERLSNSHWKTMRMSNSFINYQTDMVYNGPVLWEPNNE